MLGTVLKQSIKISCLILSCIVASTTSLVAKADQSPPPIFGDMTIGSKFSPDPFSARGMSGGSIPGAQIAGRTDTPTGLCTGFFDEKPDHILNLTNKFDYLQLKVQSPRDTTLVIRGPGGSWCNDDFDGKDPGIVGEWLQGTYQIWIGSYAKDTYFPYTITITEKK